MTEFSTNRGVNRGAPPGDAVDLYRAKAYPYDAPQRSYLFAADRIYETADEAGDPLCDSPLLNETGEIVPAGRLLGDLGLADATPMKRRHPILAIGSNRAPEQILRKYGPDAPGARGDDAIPVRVARLDAFDVVHAARFTGYGAVPATLAHAPGTSVEIAVTWLSDDQLRRMHSTEGGYDFVRLSGISLADRAGRRIDEAFAYIARNGCMGPQGGYLALSGVSASGREFPATGAEGALRIAMGILGVGDFSLDGFIAALVTDRDYRRSQIEAMAEHALPIGYEHVEIVPVR